MSKRPVNHLTLSMTQIKRERDAAAAVIRALRPLSPRMRSAVLFMALVHGEEKVKP